MKRLLLILILTLSLQTLTKADDIRDFEIEGMSIGDSLLDYFTKEEIESRNKTYHYSVKDFYQIDFKNISKLYERISFDIEDGDKNFIIANIEGATEFKNKNKNKNECKKSKSEIVNILIQNYPNLTNVEDAGKLSWDKSGKSIYERVSFKISSQKDYQIKVICQFWDESTPFGYWLKVGIASEAFNEFLTNKAYK